MLNRFPIDSGRALEFVFAKRKDNQIFRKSLNSVGSASNPNVSDAMELGILAFRRWREALSKGRVAESIEDVKDRIRDNPKAEVIVLILARAPWLRGGKLAGLCHFRRTWCNHLCIDFLTRHPSLIGKNDCRGIGTALLYFVSSVAVEINAAAIWWEATQNSAEAYQKMFEKPAVKDLVFVRKRRYNAFKMRVDEGLEKKGLHCT